MNSTRRTFLGSVAAAAVASASPSLGVSAPAKPVISADEALALLTEGNKRYIAGKTIHANLTARRDEVAPAQQPFAMILSCADSRVPPELIFDETLGALFVVRVAGNYAETGGIGSFEYAFEHFHSPLLLVLGHSGCGAVHATVDAMKNPGSTAPGDIRAIIEAIMPAAQKAARADGDVYAAAIAENARDNARKLAATAPILSTAVTGNKLRVASAVYDLRTGRVSMLT
jgi:carbonic anhydrase